MRTVSMEALCTAGLRERCQEGAMIEVALMIFVLAPWVQSSHRIFF